MLPLVSGLSKVAGRITAVVAKSSGSRLENREYGRGYPLR
jgi:hypothetical protein